MPNFTSFLQLTLPSFGEFSNSWNEPLNENFEDIDDYIDDLNSNLVGTGTGSRFQTLRGTLSSLAARLDVSINDDGTIDLDGSPGITEFGVSRYYGDLLTPTARLNNTDRMLYEASQPAPDGRFSPMDEDGPTAGFPYAEIDSGIAVRSADFGSSTANPISSPQQPWSPGLVVGGASPLFGDGGAVGRILLSAATRAALFNIDGYVFRIREDILFDYSGIGPSAGNYIWFYVERNDANYGDVNFAYSEVGGTPASRDLRVRNSGTDGVVASAGTSVFSTLGGNFNVANFPARAGDVLRILSSANAGDYIIESIDSDTQVTIRGTLSTAVGTIQWQVYDPAMPNIGAALSVSPSDPTVAPPYAAGRVYIGRFEHQGLASTRITFAKGGVYDSGWQSLDADNFAGAGYTFEHNLGVQPASIELWARLNAQSPEYPLVVRRQVVTNGATTAELLVPAVYHNSTNTVTNVQALNATTDPARPAALFTDSGGVDRGDSGNSVQVRAIIRS